MGTPDLNNPGYDTDGEPLVKGVVSATAVMTSAAAWNGPRISAILEKAMTEEVLRCNAEGLATGNPEHSIIIKERILAARQAMLDTIRKEQTLVAAAIKEQTDNPKKDQP